MRGDAPCKRCGGTGREIDVVEPEKPWCARCEKEHPLPKKHACPRGWFGRTQHAKSVLIAHVEVLNGGTTAIFRYQRVCMRCLDVKSTWVSHERISSGFKDGWAFERTPDDHWLTAHPCREKCLAAAIKWHDPEKW